MKQLHVFALIFSFIYLCGCSQPLATSTLLVSGSTATPDTSTDEEEEETGILEIKADNTDLSASLEDTDKIEISGSCNDLNRKNNRILVEVFSGESETDTPYISNAISNACVPANISATTGNGTNVGETCFFVTKGTGIIEIEGPEQKTFPQCHNGRFSFAVRLGASLVNNSTVVGQRYLARFKLRTLDGQIADSTWSRAFITRRLSVPQIEKVTQNPSDFSCKVDMLPARFNPNITYSLTRSQAGASTAAAITLFPSLAVPGPVNSSNPLSLTFNDSSTLPVSSSFNIISGVTYSYTLSSQDSTSYAGGFVYSSPLVATGTATTCETPKPVIRMSFAPQNFISDPGGASCFLTFSSSINPAVTVGSANIRWGVSTTRGWTLGGSYNGAFASVPVVAGVVTEVFQDGVFCSGSTCTVSQRNGAGLAADQTYYFAAQEIDTTIPGNLFGKWSNEVECKPPQPQ